jgi:sugar O-acyltransferase (sialic acid O-acetyltransferase NeuD family)
MIRGRLAIFGAGGHGKVVAETALASGWEDVDFYDDGCPDEKLTDGHVVLGDFEDLVSNAANYQGFHVAIGLNNTRSLLIERLRDLDLNLPDIIHPSAIISDTVSLAGGVCVLPGVIVNAGSKIGVGVILNSASVIDHDCEIGRGAHISPGVRLAGGVKVGCRTWVGIGALVIQGIKIGSDSIIGAGSVVVADVPDDVTSVGVPSRVIG